MQLTLERKTKKWVRRPGFTSRASRRASAVTVLLGESFFHRRLDGELPVSPFLPARAHGRRAIRQGARPAVHSPVDWLRPAHRARGDVTNAWGRPNELAHVISRPFMQLHRYITRAMPRCFATPCSRKTGEASAQ